MQRIGMAILLIFAIAAGVHAKVDLPDVDAEYNYDAAPPVLIVDISSRMGTGATHEPLDKGSLKVIKGLTAAQIANESGTVYIYAHGNKNMIQGLKPADFRKAWGNRPKNTPKINWIFVMACRTAADKDSIVPRLSKGMETKITGWARDDGSKVLSKIR